MAESANGPGEAAYNVAHKRTRSNVERCIGIWKARFPCIHKFNTLRYWPDRASYIITATAILHNICVRSKLPLPEGAVCILDEDEQDYHLFIGHQYLRNVGAALRNELIKVNFV